MKTGGINSSEAGDAIMSYRGFIKRRCGTARQESGPTEDRVDQEVKTPRRHVERNLTTAVSPRIRSLAISVMPHILHD
jgi:hypothetical protein